MRGTSAGRKSGGAWGQNFLVNTALAERIAARVAPTAGTHAIEIGPGRGALTRPLLNRVARLVAVEIDPRLATALEEELAGEAGFSLLRGDATRLDWEEALGLLLSAAPAGTAAVLAGNLPYHAATLILLAYLERKARDERLGRAVVMVQAEVGSRLAAQPRSKDYGSLSALAQSTHDVRLVAEAGPGSFRPRPRVRSRVVELAPLPSPLISSVRWSGHSRFLQRAFGRRRKQLAGNLAGLSGWSRERWHDELRALGVAPTARAEELTPSELAALSLRVAGAADVS